jgi:protoporphyrin/coproporphyrin ferrochelatase
MSKAKTGVLLINLGTPDSPETPDVRKYLREFLMDRRVIDIPYPNRFALINFIIAPFRAPKSSKVYKELWDEKGSPLLYLGLELKELVQKALGEDFLVSFGMRYQSPTLESAIKELEGKGLEKIIILPLFPQYSSAANGSAIEKTMEFIKLWEVIPSVSIISKFFDHPLFIKTFAKIGRKYMESKEWDHFIFSYHGLPERQILKSSVDGYCQVNQKCCAKYHSKNRYCYRAQSYETTRLLAAELGIPEEKYTVCFQSRLGKTPWIQPYADEVIPELAKKGKKKILFFSPSFIADCLETTIEGGVEYKELFKEHGGEEWQLVESLNTDPLWVECVKEMVESNS